MKFNANWLYSLYQEEAADDGAASGAGADVAENNDASTVADMASEGVNVEADKATDTKTPDWLLGKYHTEGKTIEEATAEQAKAYNELSGKFGAFTGAPEEYEVAVSEELTELGLVMDKDDPMVQEAMKFAKESNMSQEGLNNMLNLYSMQMIAENKASQDFAAEQMKALGPSAESRTQNISQWANKNLDEETATAIAGMATTAESVKAIERLITMSRSAPMDSDSSAPVANAGIEEVNAMQFEKDENGGRRIQTDKAFRARYQKMRNEVYGTGEHRVMVG